MTAAGHRAELRSGRVRDHEVYNHHVREVYRLERAAEGDDDPPDYVVYEEVQDEQA